MATPLLLFCFSSLVCMQFFIILTKFFDKVWLNPARIQSLMNSQGLKGPSYIFFHGNAKEILAMRNDIKNSPMELSHDIFPRVQPHFYSWIKIYGMNVLYWLGPQAHVIVTDPNLVKEVMSNKDGGFPKADLPICIKKLLGDGLLTSEGEKWSKITD